ncbi:cysteine-rich secretory protein LCCL domain-containing 2-like [Ruditapes philippinarum]|uniref:cysteine-rich secretory protein LCCL domain-containing 2-like n=1 Tax=Ruditapes philippinarum TaxID=129788 RepID=UPI00295B9D66|nr:cysteine-rich secretory protein LCCL domain-containing 2-like [Ruditapes philippinarum]
MFQRSIAGHAKLTYILRGRLRYAVAVAILKNGDKVSVIEEVCSQITRITRIHNKYRNKEYASDMQMLVWDTTLAQDAATWSENCYLAHQKRGLGENLAYQWRTVF